MESDSKSATWIMLGPWWVRVSLDTRYGNISGKPRFPSMFDDWCGRLRAMELTCHYFPHRQQESIVENRCAITKESSSFASWSCLLGGYRVPKKHNASISSVRSVKQSSQSRTISSRPKR